MVIALCQTANCYDCFPDAPNAVFLSRVNDLIRAIKTARLLQCAEVFTHLLLAASACGRYYAKLLTTVISFALIMLNLTKLVTI